MRSNYEHNVGKFKGAITFDMENLRDLPDHMKEIEHLKNIQKLFSGVDYSSMGHTSILWK